MKFEEVLDEILNYYPEVRYQKNRLEVMKEFLKEGYEGLKQIAEEEGNELDVLNINGILVREKVRKNYTWSKDFLEEMVDLGKAHLILTMGNKLNKRFDLRDFELPKNPENKRLKNTLRKTPHEALQEEVSLKEEQNIWKATPYEELVEMYMRYKKRYDLKNSQYEADREILFRLMKEEGTEDVTGFSIVDETTKYDFQKMYNVELQERLQLATNGEVFVDLLTDTIIELNPDELEGVEVVKKRFQKPRLLKLGEMLGDEFQFIEGYRIEENILSRFKVSTSKVEEAVDEGFLNPMVLKTEKLIEKEEDIQLVFEIITEEQDRKRRETGYEIFAKKAVERSLRMEAEKREFVALQESIKN